VTHGAFASRGTIPASDINQQFALDLIQGGLMALFRYDAAPENDAERIAPLR
jgi:hypothetical protein